MIKKYLFYLIRWQLSTPILALIAWLISGWQGAVIANLIGGLIFFWADQWIFRRNNGQKHTHQRKRIKRYSKSNT